MMDAECSRTGKLTVALALALCGACAAPADDRAEVAQVAQVTSALTQADCPAGYAVIVGTSNADTINGTAGSDCIVGLGGNDVIHGNGGNDFLIGGNGNDQLFGDDGNDQLFGEAGDDALQGGNGNDVISGEGGTDTIGGGAGNDTITGGTVGDIINGDDGDDTINGEGGDDTINGGAGNDAIWGGDGGDTVHGNDGADRIFGESGNDQLYGDADNDVIDGGANADTIRGGDGDDVIDGDLANDTLYGENGEDVLIGGAGTNTSDGGPGTDACTGTGCELPAMTPSGCTQDTQCSSGKHCVVDIGLCLGCLADGDNDGVCNSADACPSDANKSAPGICGCGVSDADSDGDGTANCNDGCPSDASKTAAGVCGCGVSDADSDNDGTANCNDGCPSDASKTAAGVCGCGVSDADSDNDGTANCNDGCPSDASKTAAGVCGCGVSDADSDGDGVANCNDGCPSDATKTAAGICGCGVSDADSDGDGVANCNDQCAGYPDDADRDGDGIPDGCDFELTCRPWSTGSAIYSGTIVVRDPADLLPLAGKQCITGDLVVDAGSLVDLSGLQDLVEIAGALRIELTNLQNVDGLDGLQRVGSLAIDGNAQLTDLGGLAQLDAVADPNELSFTVHDNVQLPGCWMWELERQTGRHCGVSGVYWCTGNRGDGSCGALPEGFVCEPGATGPGVIDRSVLIGHDVVPGPELGEMGGVSCITGDVQIQSLSDFSGFEGRLAQLQYVGGDFTVQGTVQTSLHAFAALRAIGGVLRVESNVQLSALGLDALTSVDAMLIKDNACLPAEDIAALEQQTNTPCGLRGIAVEQCDGNDTQACDPLAACTLNSVGPYTHQGDVEIGGPNGVPVEDLAGIRCITGSLGVRQSGLADLHQLSSLHAVAGSVAITDNQLLTTLDGLQSLEAVGGALEIANDPQLNQLSGLSQLRSLAAQLPPDPATALYIHDNASLPGCWAWSLAAQTGKTCGNSNWYYGFQRCDGNVGQGSCGALPPDFVCEPGAVGPGVYDGDLVLSSDGVYTNTQPDELGGLTCVTGNLSLQHSELTDLHAFAGLQQVGGYLNMGGNQQLANVGGLEQLKRVGNAVFIDGNPQLNSLAGLSGLTQVGDRLPQYGLPSLQITNNASLSACWTWLLQDQTGVQCEQRDSWGSLQPCRGNHGTSSCGSLPPDFQCMPGAHGPGVYDGTLLVGGYMGLDPADFGGLTCVTGNFGVVQSTLSDLQRFSHLQAVGVAFDIVDNDLLQSLDGLQQLRTIGSGLYVDGNPLIHDLAPLAQLTSLDAQLQPGYWPLQVVNNSNLLGCSVWALEHQTATQCGRTDGFSGQFIPCTGNHGTGSCGSLPPDFQCMPGAVGPGVYDGDVLIGPYPPYPIDLADFGGVTCITGNLLIDNASYSDLSALSTLQFVGGEIGLHNNPQLNLSGLEQLRSIGGGLYLENNPELRDLQPLANLASLGANVTGGLNPLIIFSNENLAPCEIWAFSQRTHTPCGYSDQYGQLQVQCSGNHGTQGCGSLPSDFECIPGAVGPGVYDGNVQLGGFFQPVALADLIGATCITGHLVVGNATVTDLHELSGLQFVGGGLGVFNNENLQNLTGLEQLGKVGQGVQIGYNPQLNDLSALANLSDVDDHMPDPGWSPLVLTSNPQLPGCWVWALEQHTHTACTQFDGSQNLHCSGNSGSGSCGALPPNFACVPGAVGPGVFDGLLEIGDSPGHDTWQVEDLSGLHCVTGHLAINSTSDLVDLTGLSGVQQVGGSVGLFDNAALTSTHGLENLTQIGGGLFVNSNAVLADLVGFSNITSLGVTNPNEWGALYVADNPELPMCWVDAIAQSTGVTCEQRSPYDSQLFECTGNDGSGSCQ